jgi:hypothetical protein
VSDTEEIRAVLADATALRADVRVRGTATRSVRARARQRRATALGSGAAAVALCVVVGLLALTGGEGDGRTAVPAGPVASTSPSAGQQPGPPVLPLVARGPHELGSPIEVRPVHTEYLSCAMAPSTARTVAAVYGTACYRLGAPWLVIDRLEGVDVTFATDADGMVSQDNGELVLTMTRADRGVFASRTGTAIGHQVALVVAGKVWLAPSIGSPITGGQVSLDLPVLRLRALLTALEIAPG